MADVLVDTSVWIDFFRNERGRIGDRLDALLAEDRAVLCGVVEMEIFQGLKAGESGKVWSVLEVIPYVETTRADFVDSGRLWQKLREEGRTIPSTDCLIGVLCIRHDLKLFTLHAHFDAVKELKRIRL